MSFTAKIAAFLVLIVAVFASGYKAGHFVVTADWDRERLSAANERITQQRAARAQTERLMARTGEIDRAYQAEKTRRRADALAADDALRLFNDTIDSLRIPGDSAAASGTNGTEGLVTELLGHCAGTLAELAAEADGIEATLSGLQRYVEQVCLAK
jgi:hypothetical protein